MMAIESAIIKTLELVDNRELPQWSARTNQMARVLGDHGFVFNIIGECHFEVLNVAYFKGSQIVDTIKETLCPKTQRRIITSECNGDITVYHHCDEYTAFYNYLGY